MALEKYLIYDDVNEGVHVFTLPRLDVDTLVPLIKTLSWELQKVIANNTAKSFADDRAAQHQRHLEDCKKTGSTPQQQFIDFLIPDNF